MFMSHLQAHKWDEELDEEIRSIPFTSFTIYNALNIIIYI